MNTETIEYNCERCGLFFKEKRILLGHLKRKSGCIALESDIEAEKLIEKVKSKEGIECDKCNRTYKNKNSLRVHKCKSKKNIDEDTVTKKELLEIIKEMLKNPQSVVNNDNSIKNDNSTTTNNTINVTLNCFMDTSGKPIEYLLNQENIKERVLGWMKSKNGILEYILEKFNNKDHPENKMIKSGQNKESIELHVAGKWRKYQKNKKVIKEFEKDVMTPLQWGADISEDSNKLNEKQMKKNENGEVVFEEDEIERVKRDKIQTKVINVIHEKIC